MSNEVGVVFFSKDGSTKVLASLLGSKYDAEIVELVEKSKTNMFGKVVKAVRKKSVALKGEPYNKIDGFEKLYLCTPIWASNGTPAMNAFIEKADFTGKDVMIVTVKGYPKSVEATHAYLTSSVAKSKGKVSNCYDVRGVAIGKTATKESLQKQLDSLNI
jgi:flavodoxin